MRRGWRGWRLFLFSALAIHGFYSNLQRRMNIDFWRKVRSNSMSDCGIVRNFIINDSATSDEDDDFRSFVNELRRCQWQYNEYEHDRLRLELGGCCNARHMLVVTQDNAPLGSQLQFETNPKRATAVTEEVFQMLPKISPFLRKPFKTCAVVGNGGILQDSLCGTEIDQMDFVFRLNLPPLTLAADVGTKSHLISANPSILIQKFGKLFGRRKPFIDLIKSYGSATIIFPAFSYVHNKDLSFRALYSIEDFNLENQVLFFHPEYLRKLSVHWKKMGIRAKRLSSGLMFVSAALEVCDRVTLYGFWPFPRDPDGNVIPHHYYDDITPKPGFHAMPDEFQVYTKMHLEGAIYLQVGKC